VSKFFFEYLKYLAARHSICSYIQENNSFHLSYSFVSQGEKVVPESINRLHEIAREVEDRKQQLLGTTVEAAMASSSSSSSNKSPRSGDDTGG
jgi:hypothetical protein